MRGSATIEALQRKAAWVRRQTLDMCLCGAAGHLVSSFSCTDILVALYYGGVLRLDPAQPHWDDRDRFIMSKGHGGNALFPILADMGFFPLDELSGFCCGDSVLGSHPDHNVPGVETVTGSLGHGLGIASGLALAAKLDKRDFKVAVLMGDGECYEGSVWESAMFAAHHELSNLTGIVDRNRLSVTEFTENNLRLEPFEEKWRSFGWDTACVDGHDFGQLLKALGDFRSRNSPRPLMIIANTTKGKGVSFMENTPLWHTMLPSGEQVQRARAELDERMKGSR